MIELYFKAASILVFFGSGLSLLMAIEQVTGRLPSRQNYLLCALSICNAFILMGIGSIANRFYVDCQLSYFLLMTSLFTSGPLNLMHYYSLLYPTGPLPFRVKLHFAPAIFVLILEIIFQFQPQGLRNILINGLFESPAESILLPASLLAGVHVFPYLAYLLKLEFSFWNNAEIRKGLAIVSTTDFFGIVSGAFLITGIFSSSMTIFITGGLIISLIQTVMFVTSTKYERFFKLFEKELRKKRFERSLLKGINTDLLRTRLSELMEYEKAYRDYDISIESIAERMSLTPHQLSQFLNEIIKMEFRNFINSYRVEEAMELLLKDSEHSIISICFHVGFSSKSAFNNAFKKHTGMTPSEYRIKKGTTL